MLLVEVGLGQHFNSIENFSQSSLAVYYLYFAGQVSRISDIIKSLLDYEKQKLSEHKSQEDHQELVLGVNSILEVGMTHIIH